MCNAYDAMTTDRAESAAVGDEAACQELRDMPAANSIHRSSPPSSPRSPNGRLAPGRGDSEAPVRLPADRVPTLLESAK